MSLHTCQQEAEPLATAGMSTAWVFHDSQFGNPRLGKGPGAQFGGGVLVAGPRKWKSEASGDRGQRGMEQMVADTIPRAMTAGTCGSKTP